MDMNRAFFLKKEDHTPKWHVKDAKGRVLGRLATEIADALRGKDKATFTPHTDGGDYIVVVNAKDIVLTGDKWNGKIYDRYTGWMGGYKTMTAKEMMEKHPTKIIELAVQRMLPKNRLGRTMLKKLRVYTGAEHPHTAQI